MRRKPAPASLPVKRLPFLEGLRGIAALYVVFSHFMTMSDGRRASGWVSHAPDWLYRFMSGFWYGNIAVAAFIVLSGFCLQLSLFQRADGRIANLKVYFRRRTLRILPPYYAALGLSVWVALNVTQYQTIPPFDKYVPVTQENVLAHVFLIHNFSPAWMYKINGVLWSIAIEAQLYVLFPLLVLGVFRLGRLPVLALSVLAAVAVLLTVPVAMKLYPWYLPLFVVGMMSANLAFRPNKRLGPQPQLAGLLCLMALGGTAGAIYGDYPLHVQDALSGLAVAGLCYVLTTTSQGILIRFFSWKPLAALGGFSYSLYLMHHPIQQLVYVQRPPWVIDEWTSLIYLSTVALPIILVGTYVFHLLFERPFMPRRPVTKQDLVRMSPTVVSLPLKTYAPSMLLTPRASTAPDRESVPAYSAASYGTVVEATE
jgi:peptidoglycan/LPS O-acetylase OafA/YrhL